MRKQQVKLFKEEKGSIINVVLLILVILTLVGIGLMQTGNTDTKIASNEKLSKIAYYAADAGIERAINMMAADLLGNSPDTSWLGQSHGFGDAFYLVTVTDYNHISGGCGGGGSSMLDRGEDSIWRRISGFFVSPAFASGCGGCFNSHDGNGDGYILITSKGTINNVSKTIEVILKSDGTVVSRIEQ